MSKVYMTATVKLIIDTDLTDVEEIANNIVIDSVDDSEVMVLESEIENIAMDDSK